MKRIPGIYCYHIFKKDVKFSIGEKEKLLTGSSSEYDVFHNHSILKINNDFLEVIDQKYAWNGKGVGAFLIILILSMQFLFFIFIIFLNASYELLPICGFVFILLIVNLMWFGWYIKSKEYTKDICSPILFNRNTQYVYFYINKNEYLAMPWKDVVWVMSFTDGAGGAPIYEIQAHIVEDGLVKQTFLVGFPVINKAKNYGLWNFICHYMQHGPEQLYPKYNIVDKKSKELIYCHRLVGAKESYKETWQAMRVIYRDNLLFRIVAFPLDCFSFVGRRIILNLKSVPVWPEQVRRENDYDRERSEQIDYRNNQI
ncbi:DUF6708 domain-containing protein [Acinetobacter larvae]|uniref:DUF6708 domain-containing protein n=1 Tax=Acinetobacter larvae TaxID=1789224 RepID=A0A1B2LZ42_9GAMM|nr:DUF6708 domain-containing protein [Acinetobacter larvae]AOA58169.1 hypothetical protein BFG52_07245 [Acinetobacter larvae]